MDDDIVCNVGIGVAPLTARGQARRALRTYRPLLPLRSLAARLTLRPLCASHALCALWTGWSHRASRAHDTRFALRPLGSGQTLRTLRTLRASWSHIALRTLSPRWPHTALRTRDAVFASGRELLPRDRTVEARRLFGTRCNRLLGAPA